MEIVKFGGESSHLYLACNDSNIDRIVEFSAAAAESTEGGQYFSTTKAKTSLSPIPPAESLEQSLSELIASINRSIDNSGVDVPADVELSIGLNFMGKINAWLLSISGNSTLQINVSWHFPGANNDS